MRKLRNFEKAPLVTVAAPGPREALAVTKPPLVEAMAWPIHASITIGLLGTTAFLGVLIPNVEVVLSFAGAVISVARTFNNWRRLRIFWRKIYCM